MSASGDTTAAPEALALLPLNVTGLSGPQRRGAICVWGGESLGADAISLGDRIHDGTKVFPRACPRCVDRVAAQQTPPPAPRRIWCNWHKGLADTCLLIQVHEQATTFGGDLYACAKCRVKDRLTPLGDRP